MDNFGTINGIPKRYWGDREPSDKKVIWYKNNIPYSYQDGEWKPLTGGSGSGSTLSILKAFIDSHNIEGYDYTGKTPIGVAANTLLMDSKTEADICGTSILGTTPFKTYNILAFDVESGVFVTSGINSGNQGTSKRFIFIPISTKTNTGNLTKSVVAKLLSPENMSTVFDEIANESSDPDALGWVYYDDLK